VLTLTKLFELAFADRVESHKDDSMKGIILRTALPGLDGVKRPLGDWQVAPMMTISRMTWKPTRRLVPPKGSKSARRSSALVALVSAKSFRRSERSRNCRSRNGGIWNGFNATTLNLLAGRSRTARAQSTASFNCGGP